MKLIITENISLDGVVESNEQTGEWFGLPSGVPGTSDLDAAVSKMMGDEDAQLYGRKTFEEMRGFWPNQTDDTTGVTDHLNRVDKYVISTTMDDPGWQNSTVLKGPLLDEVRNLKETRGSNLGVTGSISVGHALIEAGVIDEYRLFVYPVVVGIGRQLFDGTAIDARQLQLVDSTPFTSGVVLLRYQPTIGDAL